MSALRPLRLIRPSYLIAIALAVGLIMVISAIVELQRSKEELQHVMEEEASTLAEAIEGGSANVLLSMDLIESLVYERLLDNARALAWMDGHTALSKPDLVRFADEHHLYRINIFDRRGRKVLSNHTVDPEHAGVRDTLVRTNLLLPVLRGTTDHLVIGLKEAPIGNAFRYAVAVRRSSPRAGAIVVNIDAGQFLEFRRSVGIGKLLQDIGENSDIEYVVLQDERGIIAASRSVKEMTTFESDSLLTEAIAGDTLLSRTVQFDGRRVFEVIKPMKHEGETLGVIRIGVSTKELEATEERMQRRVWIMSLVLVVIGILVVVGIVATQNYRMVSRDFTAMQGLTDRILKSMRDAVVSIDHAERIAVFNERAEELFGISESQVLGRRVSELDGETGVCLSDMFQASEEHQEHAFKCADGKMHILSATLSQSGSDEGELPQRTAVIRDLTETRRLEQEMQRKEKLSAMGELASGIAHEIRNPLNAISMIAQRFAREFTPRDHQTEYDELTGVLRSETERMNGIIQSFLRFARPPRPDFQTVALSDIIHPLATLFRGQAQGKGVAFEETLEPGLIARVDRQLLTQAVLNLLQNALEATPAGGRITLTGAADERGIRIEVADTGQGIPADQLGKIFNLYFTTRTNGTGLGLALTQQIVTQHEGRIHVTSKVGEGTHFVISLPASPDQSASGKPEPGPFASNA